MHWLLHLMGVDDMSGHLYAFWSGFGSDLGELAILGGVYRKHQCEVARCWRLGRHKTAAGHCVCHRHSPAGAPSHADVLRAHTEALDAPPTD